MDGLPVTIRLLDPPLHEFLPQRNRDIEKFANNFNLTFEQAKDRVKSLEEVNPMLGHRGSRLLITYPEILEMQIKAIIRASIAVENRGITVIPEIMVPLIGKLEEFIFLKKIITQTAQDLFTSEQASIDYTLGTMIELPRACTAADRIAKEADFFSFGTNDLTQMTFGFSRDDVARFLPAYQRLGILTEDPFEILDQKGVGTLIEMAVNLGRGTKKDLKISVCGEHGGDPASAKFFQAHGFNIISCSPYRVPIARLAAAQAVLLARKN
jgi:pyruvate,orthophosphate dikinase